MALHQHGMAEDWQTMQLTRGSTRCDHAVLPELLDVPPWLAPSPDLVQAKNDPAGGDSGGVQ